MARETSGKARELDVMLDSTLDSVDEAERLILCLAEEGGFPEEELHKTSMAVRETVVNAVVHGNRYSSHKKVHFSAAIEEGRLVVKVADEGSGFEMSSVPDPLAEENLLHQSGRGLLLIRAFTDEFKIRHLAGGGTEVTLVKFAAQAV
jgi:serine/threonine-protein kinase RsbW